MKPAIGLLQACEQIQHWTFIGTPAIALPVHQSSNGLPLGIQLIGNYKEDEKLLNIAEFAETCFKVEG
jgi:Asp-tRNA(Asn)/Glu-tRNA(Gln) amidotransferase A subunit family amidase